MKQAKTRSLECLGIEKTDKITCEKCMKRNIKSVRKLMAIAKEEGRKEREGQILKLIIENKAKVDFARAEGKRIQEAKDDIIIKKSCILVRDNTIAEVEKIIDERIHYLQRTKPWDIKGGRGDSCSCSGTKTEVMELNLLKSNLKSQNESQS